MLRKDGTSTRGGWNAKVFSYTYDDIAEVACLNKAQVQIKAREGKFDPNSFASVVAYLIKRKSIPISKAK